MARIGDRGEMEAFVRSVDLGGFSAAARELGMSPSALSKLVSRLEDALKVQLLNRSTRKLRPTAEGELFLARCRSILAEIEDAENELSSSRQQVCGKLRVHVGVGFGMHQLVPALPRFVARYPHVVLELLLEDRAVELSKEGIDISVWPGSPAELDVIARKLCEFKRVVCAAPEYLARHGSPSTEEDLVTHNCIVLTGLPAPLATWRFQTASGTQLVKPTGCLSANNAECIRQFALMGLGIVRLNEFIVSSDIRDGRLKALLIDEQDNEPVPLHVLYLHARYRLPRVAAMLEFLIESFEHSPWRTGKTCRRPAPQSKPTKPTSAIGETFRPRSHGKPKGA